MQIFPDLLIAWVELRWWLTDPTGPPADAGVVKFFTKKQEDEDIEDMSVASGTNADVEEPQIKDTFDVPPDSAIPAAPKALRGQSSKMRLFGGPPMDETHTHAPDAGIYKKHCPQHLRPFLHRHKKAEATETIESEGASEGFTDGPEASVLFDPKPSKPSHPHGPGHCHHRRSMKPKELDKGGKSAVVATVGRNENERDDYGVGLEPTASLLIINPSTRRPYPKGAASAHDKLKSKVTMFLPGMRSLPEVYEHHILEPAMAPVPPSLMVERTRHKPQVLDELKVLAYAEHLFIRSTYEMMPFFYGVPNRYEVIDSLGQRIYFAKEMSGFWTRYGASYLKNFIVSIVDFKNKEVCSIEGEPGFCQGAAQVLIYHESELWGRVCEELNCWTPRYDVFDGDEKLLYIVRGPKGSACYGTYFLKKNVDFPLLLADGRTQIGKFSTQWTGPVRDIYTTANNFGVRFDKNLDIKLKTILLGAAFLLYFQYFEQGGGQPNSRTLYQHGRGYNRLGRIPVVLCFLLPLLTFSAVVAIVYVFETLP